MSADMSARSKKKVKNSKRTAKRSLPPRPGIRIRDVPSTQNPTPVSSIPVEEDIDASLEELFLEDTLTENRLRSLAGKRNLNHVDFLELHDINSSMTSLSELGSMLPNLQRLKLRDCVLESFRDFGTQLRNLKVLWIRQCGLKELDGITGLTGLEELYISFNNISDLAPLALHENVQILDLESNNVEDWSQIEQLGTCPRLHSLTLEANPIARIKHYRRVIYSQIPQLKILDDQPFTKAERKKVDLGKLRKHIRKQFKKKTAAEEAASELDMITEAIKCRAATRMDYAEEERFSGSSRYRARSAGRLGKRARRPKMARRPASGSDASSLSQQLMEYKTHAKDMGKESSMLKLLKDVGVKETTASTSGSSLTMGTSVTFAGNPVMAMRRLKEESTKPQEKSSVIIDTLDNFSRNTEGKTLAEVKAEFKNFNLDEAVAKLRKDSKKHQALRMARPGTAAPEKTSFFGARRQQLMVSTSKDGVDVLKIHDDSDPEDEAVSAADPIIDTPKRLQDRPRRSMVMMRPSTAAASTSRQPLFIRTSMTHKKDENVKDGEAIGDEKSAKDAPSIAGPRTKKTVILPPKKKQVVSRLASLKEHPDEDALANSTEDLDSIARHAASPLRKNPDIARAQSKLGRSQSFNTSLSDEAEPDAKASLARDLSDKEVVEMLRKKPRYVPQLQTKDSFRAFFSGVSERRMRRLLTHAYRQKKNPEHYVQKRLRLLDGVLTKP